MVRNIGLQVGLCLAGMLAAGLLIGLLEVYKVARLRRLWDLLGTIAFIACCIVLLFKVVAQASDPIRPTIAAQIVTDAAGVGRVVATASTANLPADDTFNVEVRGLRQVAGTSSTLLLHAAIGPAPDGKAAVPIDYQLTQALYDQVEIMAWAASDGRPSCGPEVLGTKGACIELPIPVDATGPQLAADVSGGPGARALNASLRTRAGSEGSRPMIFRVTVVDAANRQVASYDSIVRPGTSGSIVRAATLPIPDVDAKICVVAYAPEDLPAGAPRCPQAGATITGEEDFQWVSISVAAPADAPSDE